MAIVAVSAVLRDADGRYLLVMRSAAPETGRWTLPGGKVEPGESLHEALVREVREETGLWVRVGVEVGVLERAAPNGMTFAIHCFTAEPLDGVCVAGSDAAAVRWVTVGELGTLTVTDGLLEGLRQWHQL